IPGTKCPGTAMTAVRAKQKIEGGGGRPRSGGACRSVGGDAVAVADAIDRAGVVVGNQQRAVLHDQEVDRPADVVVVLQETGEERVERLQRAVLVELGPDDVP